MGWRQEHPELDELTARARELRADRLLYAADPDLAISLGYEPPPARNRSLIERGIRRWSEQQLLTRSSARTGSGTLLHNYRYINTAFGPFN